MPTLADVAPSAAAALGARGFANALDFPDVQHAVICLVDGLGWRLLQEFADAAPVLSAAPGGAIDSVFPTTTPAALASLGTGLLPGMHGLVGATFWLPEEERVLAPLTWADGPSPLAVQPEPTVFERVIDQGIAVTTIAAPAYEHSGLTGAALRGPTYHGAVDVAERVRAVQQSTASTGRTLTYVYTPDLDRIGHGSGVGSAAWLDALRAADLLVESLAASLPRDATLVVTADHGMVNCPASARVVIDDEPMLRADVEVVAGEPRARHLYVAPGRTEDVATRWRDRLRDDARVMTRAEVIDAGLLGPVDEALVERIGDVVVIAQGETALASSVDARVSALIGQHGALSPAEWEVPALWFHGPARVGA